MTDTQFPVTTRSHFGVGVAALDEALAGLRVAISADHGRSGVRRQPKCEVESTGYKAV
ncbi:MAG: hypothetical protein HN423_06615 [Alphaproteobacteria bacterium]|nr:hypothetical protein [Alphaproteobacteria bacterium]